MVFMGKGGLTLWNFIYKCFTKSMAAVGPLHRLTSAQQPKPSQIKRI